MKRGPDHSEKVTQCNPSFAQVALGIPEIVATILHHYPRYGLRGQNNLVTVSKVWHEAIKQWHLQDEPTFERLIADCLKCPESVIHILRDNTLLPYLSEEQILRLISCHGEFAISLLENDVLPINHQSLLVLTKYHLQVAMYFFNDPQWFKRIKYNLYAFGCQHPEIAQYILDNNLTDGNDLIRREGLNKLAESSLVIARKLLNDSVTFGNLTEPTLKGPQFLYKHLELLIELGKTNESFAFLHSHNVEINTPEDFINHFEILCELGLSEKEVGVLGDYHPEIALKVLQNETIFARYIGINRLLMIMGWVLRHEVIAMHVLETNNISDTRLSDLCKIHRAVATHVSNTPHLYNRLCINNLINGALLLQNAELAIAILKSNTADEQLNIDALMRLASGNPSVAKYILTTKKLYTKLSEANVRTISNQYPHIVRKILNTSSLRDLVEHTYLSILESIGRAFVIKPFLVDVSEKAKCWDLQSNKPKEEMNVDAVAKFTLKK
ncbi:hypothetical protein [Candidatus Berkiella aquae]|uniref:Uncharacterized protein n=1 Tax=Candidatus Berkiella aquae TaxID=295108 RepID=A0A0Q9YMW5_9GAMM|nr:hypothetical protein [Candidatus Berkiella aquae]MCS5711108.1 hypothetical protein [Candidatus Berkiella aquae]